MWLVPNGHKESQCWRLIHTHCKVLNIREVLRWHHSRDDPIQIFTCTANSKSQGQSKVSGFVLLVRFWIAAHSTNKQLQRKTHRSTIIPIHVCLSPRHFSYLEVRAQMTLLHCSTTAGWWRQLATISLAVFQYGGVGKHRVQASNHTSNSTPISFSARFSAMPPYNGNKACLRWVFYVNNFKYLHKQYLV